MTGGWHRLGSGAAAPVPGRDGGDQATGDQGADEGEGVSDRYEGMAAACVYGAAPFAGMVFWRGLPMTLL